MASQWFCRVLGQEVGPVSFKELAEMLRAGTLKETDPVRREGATKWTRAREVIGLFRAATKEPAKASSEAEAQPQAQAQPKSVEAPARSEQGERPSSEPPRPAGPPRGSMSCGPISISRLTPW